MAPRLHILAVIALLATPSALTAAAPAPAAASGALSASNSRTKALCPQPAPGYSSCLSLALIPDAPLSLPGSRSVGGAGSNTSASESSAASAVEHKNPFAPVTPTDLRSAYGLSETPAPAETQTVAIVDAYSDPNAEADLAHFSKTYALPSCPKENGCLRVLNEQGNASPLPEFKGESEEKGWVVEISTDLDTVHSVCPSCHIVLVEADSPFNSDLSAAEEAAVKAGATEITNSWGGPSEPEFDAPAFIHPGVVITAAAGDSGYDDWLEGGGGANYPASSPHVVAVGGTRLRQKAGTWEAESVWNDGAEGENYGAGGGGCSAVYAAPTWQSKVANWAQIGCAGKRAVADVSADADPLTGVNVYDSTASPYGEKGWMQIGGTSVASPIIASVFALAGGAHGVAYPARTLYENAGSAGLHDITEGSNGECAKPLNENGSASCSYSEEAESCSQRGVCLAGAGYDGPTGVGTPNGISAFQPAPGAKEEEKEEPRKEEAHNGGPSGVGGSGGPILQPIPPSPGPPGTSVRVARVFSLQLTRSAIIALNRAHPSVSRVAFSFRLSAPARVTISFSNWARVHRHVRWKLLLRTAHLASAPGVISAHLIGKAKLRAGRYELTVTPAGGVPLSLVFQIN